MQQYLATAESVASLMFYICQRCRHYSHDEYWQFDADGERFTLRGDFSRAAMCPSVLPLSLCSRDGVLLR